MAAIGRWGNSFDLDFWTAAACGEVDGPEMRAVDLLRHTTDEERFGYYCATGMLPAMGNVTGRIYLVQRGGGALELDDGLIVASWCISIGPHATEIPGTDQVVVLRNMIEGEELDFLEIGNRNPVRSPGRDAALLYIQRLDDWLPDAYRESFGCDMGEAENEEMLELAEIRAEDWYGGVGLEPVEPYQVDDDEVHAGLLRRIGDRIAEGERLGDDLHGYIPYEPIRRQAQAELDAYWAARDRDDFHGPLEPADAAMEEIAVTEDEIDGDMLDAAGQELMDVHGPEIGEDLGRAIMWPDGRVEHFLPVPRGPYIPVRGLGMLA